MLEFYNLVVKTYHNDELMGADHATILIDEEDEHLYNYSYDLTWNDLTDFYHKFGLYLPFNIWNFKKGRLISFFNASLFNRNSWDIKEWKTNSPNITITFSTSKINKSIVEVLKWHDADKAIQYLKEKGLTINVK